MEDKLLRRWCLNGDKEIRISMIQKAEKAAQRGSEAAVRPSGLNVEKVYKTSTV